jgi:hypothetical protein
MIRILSSMSDAQTLPLLWFSYHGISELLRARCEVQHVLHNFVVLSWTVISAEDSAVSSCIRCIATAERTSRGATAQYLKRQLWTAISTNSSRHSWRKSYSAVTSTYGHYQQLNIPRRYVVWGVVTLPLHHSLPASL